jgi:hypothetical protein
MRILKKRAKAVRAFVVFGATVALVGLVVACQGPAGLQGAPGDKGEAGPVGEMGAPGDPTLANALPSLIKEFPAVRLEDTGGTSTSRMFDLSTHFKDEETLYLTFSAKTDKDKIATVELSAVPTTGPQNTLKIIGVAKGKAIVTVTAYDGVNDPLSAVIDVSVVEDNSPPTIDAPAITGGLLPLFTAALDPLALGKLYLSGPYSGAESFKFSAQISTGEMGTTEDGDSAKFVVMYGDPDLIATSTIATASVSPAPTSASLVEYTVTVTPLKAGMETETITIFVEDGFGVKTEVGDFPVTVNTPPALVLDSDKVPVTMDDVTLYVSGTGPAGPMVLRPSMVIYTAEDHFVVEADDTVCAYVTNPTVLPTGLAAMMVNADAATIAVVANSLPNGRSFQLTISCSDKEATVSDSATITIHN